MCKYMFGCCSTFEVWGYDDFRAAYNFIRFLLRSGDYSLNELFVVTSSGVLVEDSQYILDSFAKLM